MRSINAIFNKIRERNPFMGDYCVLRLAILGRGYSSGMIARHFNQLVPKDDYASNEKKQILADLVKASNTPEGDKKSGGPAS